jgi:large subunit ribosomal protein L15
MTINNYLTTLVKKRKVVGRGIGSGRGKTAGRGTKGQKSRKSGRVRLGFEGGQTPVYRRFPKRGFTKKKIVYQVINLEKLEKDKKIKSGETVDFSVAKPPVKVLGKGELSKKIIIKAHAFSQSAQQKITQIDGKFQVVKRK